MNSLKSLLLICFIFTISVVNAQQDHISKDEISSTLSANYGEIVDIESGWSFDKDGYTVFIAIDESKKTIRVFTIIKEDTDLSKKEMRDMLNANFISTSGCRYGVVDANVLAIYVHTLDHLDSEEIVNAVEEVVNLASTYGSGYTVKK